MSEPLWDDDDAICAVVSRFMADERNSAFRSAYDAAIELAQAYRAERDEMQARIAQLEAQPVNVPPPNWSLYPWANYACLVPFSGDGIFFMWYYWEVKPEWGERSYNRVDGKWGPGPTVQECIPLSAILDVRQTLQHRPTGQGEAAWQLKAEEET